MRWAALCAALAGVGLAVASLTSTRMADAPAFQPALERGEGPADVAAKGEPGERDKDEKAARASSARGEPPARDATRRRDAKLITRGVTVQVLNGTRARRADDRMLRRLGDLGYHVLAINRSAVRYKRTTVLWSRREGRAAAGALAQRFGWEVGRKPRNLSASVTFHVVVGRDEI